MATPPVRCILCLAHTAAPRAICVRCRSVPSAPGHPCFGCGAATDAPDGLYCDGCRVRRFTARRP